MPVLLGSGTPYDIGFQHGKHQSVQIRTIMMKMVDIMGEKLKTMQELQDVIAEPTLHFHEEDLEEIQGLADGIGLPFESALGHNLGVYPAYLPGCVQAAVRSQYNGPHKLVHIANEDSPISSLLGSSMSRILHVRRPANGLKMVTTTMSGQVGGLNGINEAGLGITSTILLDRPRRSETSTGVVHPAIVKKLLHEAEDIPAAIEVLRTMRKTGAWSLCLSHTPSDTLAYLEYDGSSELRIQQELDSVLTTNHCMLFDPLSSVPVHSEIRMSRLHTLFQWESQSYLIPEVARDVLRDRYDQQRNCVPRYPTKNTIRRVDNQASLVMRPEQGELWMTAGPMDPDRENDYFRFSIPHLLHEM